MTLSTTGPVPEINITPLIDVMLVLLVIFMVVTPVARRGLDAAVPQRGSSGGPPLPRPVVVRVEPAVFALDGMPVSGGAELEARLRQLVAPRLEKTVLVQAKGTIPYARVIEAVDAGEASTPPACRAPRAPSARAPPR